MADAESRLARLMLQLMEDVSGKQIANFDQTVAEMAKELNGEKFNADEIRALRTQFLDLVVAIDALLRKRGHIE